MTLVNLFCTSNNNNFVRVWGPFFHLTALVVFMIGIEKWGRILPVNLAWQWRQSVFYHKMGSFCIYKQLKRIRILCYGEFMESAILHNIRCLSFSVVYKCRRIPSYDLKYTLTSLSRKVDREYSRYRYLNSFWGVWWRNYNTFCELRV